MAVLKVVLLSVLAASVLAGKGLDLSASTSFGSFRCAFKAGYKFAIIRGSRSTGSVDSSMRYSVQNANRAGLKTDLYLYPCVGRNATAQAYNMLNALAQQIALIDTVWIDVEASGLVSQSCSWAAYSPESNCKFVEELANAIKAKGKKVGIYSNWEQWRSVFGSTEECLGFSSYPLWYAHYNNLESFSGFKPFGGWAAPAMKQHTENVKICTMNADLVWKP